MTTFLHCQTTGSNKYYYIDVRREENNTYSAVAYYGRIGSSPNVVFLARNAPTQIGAEIEAQKKIREKIKKGYHHTTARQAERLNNPEAGSELKGLIDKNMNNSNNDIETLVVTYNISHSEQLEKFNEEIVPPKTSNTTNKTKNDNDGFRRLG